MNFLQVIVNSLPQMAIYSLATIGIVLIFRTTGTTNFAQGLIATLGTFMTTQMALYAGLPLWLGLIIGMAVAFLMGIFMDVVLIRNARKINASGKQMITMGMLLILSYVIPVIFKNITSNGNLGEVFESGPLTFKLFGVTLTIARNYVYVIILAILLLAVVFICIFGLIGPNGAGKTTVFNCITQFYKPTGGLIYYRNREDKVIVLNKYQVHDVIKTGIVRTFQNVEVIYELSILDNLLIAAHTQYKSNIFAQMFNTKGVKQEEAVNRKKALKVLEYCGLLDKKDLPPVGLPYGVLKRIELARTLMAGASLIILDEPAAGLNDNETIELAQMIRRIRDEFNVTIFLVEHDMGLVMDICEHICAISFGKKLAYGTPQEIQENPVVQEAYLGTNEVKKEAQNG